MHFVYLQICNQYDPVVVFASAKREECKEFLKELEFSNFIKDYNHYFEDFPEYCFTKDLSTRIESDPEMKNLYRSHPHKEVKDLFEFTLQGRKTEEQDSHQVLAFIDDCSDSIPKPGIMWKYIEIVLYRIIEKKK